MYLRVWHSQLSLFINIFEKYMILFHNARYPTFWRSGNLLICCPGTHHKFMAKWTTRQCQLFFLMMEHWPRNLTSISQPPYDNAVKYLTVITMIRHWIETGLGTRGKYSKGNIPISYHKYKFKNKCQCFKICRYFFL